MTINLRSTRSSRPAVRLGAVVAAAGLVTLGVAAPASAHVSVSASESGAGSYSVLTFSVPHGCDGAATTKIAIQVPEGINSVTPTRNSLYDVKKTMQELDPPVADAHGNEITERVSVVTYTARTPLPDGYRDTMELSLQLPDAAGETLAFPVVQSCTKGQTAWTEVAAEGDDAELDHPAPLVTITEAVDGGHHGADTDDETAENASVTRESVEQLSAGSTSDSDGNGLAVAGLVAGVLGLLAGGVALARSGRQA